MKEEKDWVYFEDIEWDDAKYNRFNVDTRDFHCGYTFSKEIHPDWEIIKKYKKFFHTEDELKTLLLRYYIESGGKGEWRMMDLDSKDGRVTNWYFKYIRIWRTELGFLVCNSDNKAVPKDVLSSPVNKKYLNFH